MGRTQEIVYSLNQLISEGDLPEIPIFIDSPLAVSATEVFRMHPEEWDEEVQDFLSENGRRSPFDATNIFYVRDARRSKQLNFMSGPAVIISASGMAESGRILHHLKHGIEDRDNSVVLVSFQAEHTLGRRLADGAQKVRIFGEEHDVRARVVSIEGYSAHADQPELLDWMRAFDRTRLQQAFVVHGEPSQALVFADKLREEGIKSVSVPERGNSFEL